MTVLRVLLVDDEPLLLSSMQRHLRAQPWEVVTEVKSVRAIDHVLERETHLVVSDCWMPHLDGPTLLASVRDKSPITIRVLMSGSSDSATLAAAKASGLAHHVLEKPWPVGAWAALAQEVHAHFMRSL